jgi:putative endopeptidase
MDISKESYLQNQMNADKWWYDFKINKLGKPVNKDEWDMFPQTYNAYYDPSNNEIVFPAAAFIVPGYEDAELDDATMWGYVGASYIGHEITHGFDDQGRLYDDKGNLHNWWTKEDSLQFTKRAEGIIKQFNAFEPVTGYHINGEVTQGENIADLGGLEIGLTAFEKSKAFKDNKVIDGFTPMQRFFLGYALSWLYETRDESLKTQLLTDPHAPAKSRVNGPFVNIDEFYKAFNVKPGDEMYVPDSSRVKIW